MRVNGDFYLALKKLLDYWKINDQADNLLITMDFLQQCPDAQNECLRNEKLSSSKWNLDLEYEKER